jgi:pantoate--beta-alanine ligase
MQVVSSAAELAAVRARIGAMAFVPTMGNLHQGHLSLVREAQRGGDPVVVSLFVNRLQFGPSEDFDRYPRTMQRDLELLESQGCDVVFAPNEGELYPEPQRTLVQPDPALADVLEGAFRPGFFTGVCTVVLKLFNIVQPRVAYFGQKDYQQLLIIRRMAAQLALPLQIVGCDTQREPGGLAMSSRNGYLSATERAKAQELQQALQRIAGGIARGDRAYRELEAREQRVLANAGWQPDYIAIRRRSDLAEADPQTDGPDGCVVLAAAKLGSTRLIDNLEC